MGHYYFQKIRISVILLTLLILPLAGWAQVGIGTTTPDSNALLELDASTTVGGFLMPRVALTATDNPSPLSGIITPGMTVYNTATAGSGANVVTPGFYYHDGTIWIRVGSDADAKNNWSLTGNSGTNPTDHFLGTKDAQPLLIKTNGIERMRVLADGNVQIGTGAAATQRLQVNGNFRLNGAFMPNNQAGGNDKLLLSKGTNNAPAWGPGFLNTAAITNIGKYYIHNVNFDSNTYLRLSVNDTNMTSGTAVICNFTGPFPTTLPFQPIIIWGSDITLFAEPTDGAIIFHIVNYTDYDITGSQIVFTAFYD